MSHEQERQMKQYYLGEFFKDRPNINFENVPDDKNEEKHNVTNKTLKTLEKVMIQQDNYGMEKYKKPLAHTMHYDWMAMFLEEMADGLKYIQNERDMKALIIKILEFGLGSDDPKYHIEHALRLLTVKGTGK